MTVTGRGDLPTAEPLRVRGGEGERQGLAVGTRTQCVVGSDRLLEADDDRVVGDRAAVAEQVGRVAEPPTGANALPLPAGLVALACSGCGSEKLPLTRWPVATELGSETESVPSPAVEITFAVVDACSPWRGPG